MSAQQEYTDAELTIIARMEAVGAMLASVCDPLLLAWAHEDTEAESLYDILGDGAT